MSIERLQECSFHSPALVRDMPYMAVLPSSYADSERRYPVLYLLHGWNGDYKNWCTLTNLVAYAERYEIIIITPDGQNSWYVNSATAPADRFYDYIAADLIAEVDGRFRTISSAHRRAIAGLSMGGYGSFLVALKHPEMFSIVGSISGAFDAPCGIEKVLPDVCESIEHAYGEATSAVRRESNVFDLVKRAPATVFPYIFLQCGADDLLLPSNRRFVAEISARKLAYEYHEMPGDHTWEFWDSVLPPLLRIVARIIPEQGD
jgi:S-formylglutathione hydrolase FrmB